MLSKIISKEQENPHPLTTEEPIHHDHLIDFIQHLNEIEPALISPATLEEKHEPNKFFTPGLTNLSKDSLTLEETTSDDTDDDDPQLLLTTEANRHIPLHRKSLSSSVTDNDNGEEDAITTLKRKMASIKKKQKYHLLVFAENPIIEHRCDRYVVTHIYGAGPQGNQYIQEEEYNDDGDEEEDHDHKRTNFEINIKTTVGRPICTKKKARSYMVACDFSKESYYAMEWVMGTMMRDGDELHIVAAVNREDNPEVVKKTGLSLKSELQMGSNKITQAAKDTLNQMLLYNIKLVTHTIAGRIKSVLYQMIKEKSFNLVVCGSRGRNSVKGLFMGSISSYLVHKSPVPVSVIQMDKKKKKEKQKPSKKVKKPTPLSESVKTGKLTVDELSLQKKK
ncbi:hypothetical protein BJ944DRAFT_238828 [Cunninghamella echinulata]|nr:hypothetical protein BJ944DRAFT_238828 [Cunninghamella echinulata]